MSEPSSDILTTAFEQLGPLRRPVLLVALRGWFDAAEAATSALHAIAGTATAPVVASIDPDTFFDFTQERPEVTIDDDGVRSIIWPANDFRLLRRPSGEHDLVVLAGVEPHLRLATFAGAVIRVAGELHCEAVVTVGAAADAVPHTRTPVVVGSTTSPDLASALGLSRPQYQGVTGLAGVLHERLEHAGIPAISLRIGVPHYLGNARHPRASAALVEQIGRILGDSLPHGELLEEADRWRALHDEVVSDDPRGRAYVATLEREYDRMIEFQVPGGDDLAEQFERFLRDQDRGQEGNQ